MAMTRVSFREALSAAIANDQYFFAQVNALDSVQIVTDILVQIFGILAIDECSESFLNDFLLSFAQKLFLAMGYMHDDPDLFESEIFDTVKNWVSDLVLDFGKCILLTTTGPGGVVQEVFYTLADLLGTYAWLLESGVDSLHMLVSTLPYDELSIGEITLANCTATGELELNQTGLVKYSCSADGATTVKAKFVADDSTYMEPLNYDPQTGNWVGEQYVQPNKSGLQQVIFHAWNTSGDEATCQAGITVNSNARIEWCRIVPHNGQLVLHNDDEVDISCKYVSDNAAGIETNLEIIGGHKQVFLTGPDANGTWTATEFVYPLTTGQHTITFTASEQDVTSTYDVKVSVLEESIHGDSKVSFKDPTEQWTINLTLPDNMEAWVETVDDNSAITGQIVKINLEGWPTNPHAWDPIPVIFNVQHQNMKSWNLYSLGSVSDPTSRHLISGTTDSALYLRGDTYYLMYLYPNSGPYSGVIFHLYGTE